MMSWFPPKSVDQDLQMESLLQWTVICRRLSGTIYEQLSVGA